jgi:hypothetical protein
MPGERLASRKMRVKSLQVVGDLAASYSSTLLRTRPASVGTLRVHHAARRARSKARTQEGVRL